METARLETFSDGVFAIAITLLALELRPPEHWDGAMGSLAVQMARPFGAFLFSFVMIAIYWINHRRMFGRFRSADIGLTVLNLFLLGLITLTPVITNLVAEAGPRSAAFALYVGLICGIGAANALLWAWAAFARPGLFVAEPPGPTKVVVTAVMLVPVAVLPILAFAIAGRTEPWTIALVLVVVAAIRGLRAWAARTGSRQWMP